MPKGKVKSFLAVNDTFELGAKCLLGKGWKNPLQTQNPPTPPSLPSGLGLGLQEPPAMVLVAQTGAGMGGGVEAGGSFHPTSHQAGVGGSGHRAACQRADRTSLRGDGADLCSPGDSRCRVECEMLALALSPICFHQQPKSAPRPPSFNPEERGV